jgi:hypothetical protein
MAYDYLEYEENGAVLEDEALFEEYELEEMLDEFSPHDEEEFLFEDDEPELEDYPVMESEYLAEMGSDPFADLEEEFEANLYDDEFADPEGDLFFGKLLRGAGRWIKRGIRAIKRSPLFKTLAQTAAKTLGAVLGGPGGAALAGAISKAVLREAEFETEAEAEAALYESELDFEDLDGDMLAYAEMEDAAALAAEAESEAEADRAIDYMVRRAPTLLRHRGRLRTAYPKVMRAAAATAKLMRANPRTRWAVRVMPLVIRRTLQDLSRARVVNNKVIIQSMARNVSWVLANRRRAVAALSSHRNIRRRAGRGRAHKSRRVARRRRQYGIR